MDILSPGIKIPFFFSLRKQNNTKITFCPLYAVKKSCILNDFEDTAPQALTQNLKGVVQEVLGSKPGQTRIGVQFAFLLKKEHIQ